ncbi:hypothetical protein HPB50_013216 [Hyalomma asiaticum]|uniref:Uncharacterized protein n=1 Tax=Hyalomma asiaticum TaxID=266040 RepID=A0ACB7T633_HYAAI|nr:hypothetical protein HPB50_013216 [Hyalomma asiaticum]
MAQPLEGKREIYAGPLPIEMQWAASPYWPAAPVDFWAQSATGQGYPDLSCNEEAERSATSTGVSAVQSTWMSNVARMLVFSVLLIALLVASLLLGRTSTWLAEHDEATGQPADHQQLSPLAAGVASGRSKGVGSWIHANASQPLGNGAKIFNSREKTPPEEAETTEEATSTVADMPQLASRRARQKKFCGTFFFTFCDSPKHEFYFDSSRGACLSVADSEGAALCNRGENKFTSAASCDAACGSNANTVEQKCEKEVLLTECKSEDIAGPLWFYNGTRCQQWNFPAGLCPATSDSKGSLFATSEDCQRSCGETGSRAGRCPVPREVACEPDRLKQPYFANMQASGAAERCLQATAANLARHLCLAGKNRFKELEACRKACVRGARV